MAAHGRFENEKLSQEADGERKARERKHGHQASRGQARGDRLPRPLKSEISSLPDASGDVLQNEKGQKSHQQVAGEVKRNRRARWPRSEAGHANEKIARVSDARISEKAFEICLRHRRKIAVDQRAGRPGRSRTMRSLSSMLEITRNGSRTLRRTTKPAAFEATERNAVIGVGAP